MLHRIEGVQRLVPKAAPARRPGLTAALASFALLGLGVMSGCAVPPQTAPTPAAASANAAPVPAPAVPPRTRPGGSTVDARHGGLVLDDQGVRIELVAQAAKLTLYLSEADKPLSTQGAYAHITVLSGLDINDVELFPTPGLDRLSADGQFRLLRGTRVITRITLADGRLLNVRFLVL